MPTVIVPAFAGALSALGMLIADEVRDFSVSALGHSDLATRLAALERQALRAFPGCLIERSADVRYQGQSYELNVAYTAVGTARAFHREHQRAYGYATPTRAVEVVTLRVRARRKTLPIRLKSQSADPPVTNTKRSVWIVNRWKNIPVLDRSVLGSAKAPGPALLLDYGSTTLIPPGWSYHKDATGNVILQYGGAS